MFSIASNAQNTPTSPKKSLKKAPSPPPEASAVPYRLNAEVMTWARDVAQRRDLDVAWVEKAVGEARFVPQVQRLMRPGSGSFQKNWAVYRSRFIDPVRIQAGVRFWQTHRAALQRAEAEYGVPAAIIVGIIGVETIYGRDMGSFRVIDALATLAFDFPTQHPRAATRQAFFRDELEKFLSLKNRTGLDPLSFRGSYAGAMGLPQFMPSSWTQYAVDFDGDGKVDLFNTPADAIGSVANYFKGYGWTTGMPTHFEARFAGGSAAQTPALPELLGPDILPSFSAADLSAKGMALTPEAAAHTGKLALVELKNGSAAETYVLGTQNFYVITRYNWSAYYAMAVIDLADEVARLVN
jgi:membrane-bound lytic murein transglycosylase B